ncbi:MAG: hypothetical protein ACRD1T_15750 [Acidimicrobiia bacterium]
MGNRRELAEGGARRWGQCWALIPGKDPSPQDVRTVATYLRRYPPGLRAGARLGVNERIERGAAGAGRVREAHSVDKVASDLEELYDRVVQES